jgi:membrane-bound lytic murein transglycosylase D
MLVVALTFRLPEAGAQDSRRHAPREPDRNDDLEMPVLLPIELTSRVADPTPSIAEGSSSLAWLQGLRMPDFPVRLTDPVIEQLETIRAQGWWHDTMERWLRRSGRFEGMIRRVLREEGVPQDLIYVAMIESSYTPTARSRAGATGLWQFMPAAGSERGLRQDHWVDQRLDPERSTRAAARTLRHLHDRLGSWELVFASYNMGYYGLLTSIRTYNTNDYWRLRTAEFALPQETRNYVPRIVAAAVVGLNPERFGLGDVVRDHAMTFEVLDVPRSTGLGRLARLLGTSTDVLRELNPELRRGRTPPGPARYGLRVPVGTRDKAMPFMARLAGRSSKLSQHQVRTGEDLDSVARDHGTSRAALAKLNELRPGDAIEPGSYLIVPAKAAPPEPVGEVVTAVVPDRRFAYRDRTRVFYEVVSGDTLEGIARGFGVTPGDLVLWNDLDPAAELQSGMVLQVFVPIGFTGERVDALDEGRVRLFVARSTELYEEVATSRDQRRIVVQARPGDTLQRICRRYGISMGLLARINHFGRNHVLEPGEDVILYVSARAVPRPAPAPAPAPPPAPAPAPAPDAGPDASPAAPADGGPDAAPRPESDADAGLDSHDSEGFDQSP